MPNYRITVATASHIGDREYQQDRVEVLQHPYNKHCLMVVLADGMGGRSGGAMASEQVVQSAREMLAQFDVDKDDPAAMMRQLIADAHAVIRMLNVSSEHEPHSTVAAHLLLPCGTSHWVHSGDSRIYHFHRGRLRARTRDHSYVQSLIDKGEITEEAASRHPQSNLLMGCLGMQSTPPISQFTIPQVDVGDVILSCSDGLWAYFTEQELAKMVDALTASEACQRLLSQARKRAAAGGDNVSLAILKVNPQASSQEDHDRLVDFDW